jgi:hypothetical protein
MPTLEPHAQPSAGPTPAAPPHLFKPVLCQLEGCVQEAASIVDQQVQGAVQGQHLGATVAYACVCATWMGPCRIDHHRQVFFLSLLEKRDVIPSLLESVM